VTGPGPGAQPVWVVAGMHRSGTSAAARLLHARGVDMGREMIPADPFNPAGYYEDAAVVRFHQAAFAALLPGTAGAHPDWGWTRAAAVSASDLEPWRAEATSLVAERTAPGTPWGFKDPRATVVLDFWAGLLPEARYLVVYRRPDLVADSIQRLGADVFLRDPGAAWKIWWHYNTRLLDFVRRHRDHCAVVDAATLRADPDAITRLLVDRFGAPLGDPSPGGPTQGAPGSDQMRSPFDPVLARAVWPECFDLYDEFAREADVPADGGSIPEQPSPPADRACGAPMDDVSVVVCTHDDAPFLVEALSSVGRCTDGRVEVLVCDDGTTDPEHLLVLDRLEAAGYYIVRQANAGLPAARNRLIASARGTYVLPLDADNRLLPGFIERALVAFAADPRLGVVHGDRRFIGGRTGEEVVPEFRLERAVRVNEIDACAMVRRDAWVEAGGYDELLDCGEDWELWLHLAELGWRFRHLPGLAFEYRVRPDSLLAVRNTPEWGARFRRMQLARYPDLLVAALPRGLRRLALARPTSPGRAVPRSGAWARRVARTYWGYQWRPHRLRRRARGVVARLRAVPLRRPDVL
jgi:glycosyltransferase involved in cell wall biosynthesis